MDRDGVRSWPRFNPRPCGRGDEAQRGLRNTAFSSFNPRPCGRGDIKTAVFQDFNGLFQSTPLWEGRPLPFGEPP